MTALLIDNYDSYTYNVFHLMAEVSGEEPIVIRNDAVSWKALSPWDFDAIVLSPGPGHPRRWHDFGVCADILRFSEIPVLGICLGHQGLGQVLDGTVATAPTAMHGRLSRVRHLGSDLFAGIPQDFSVVRYHSLAVGDSLGPEGRITAWTAEGVVMGIEHVSRPLWGVQFHPESVASEHGHQLIENFYGLARRRQAAHTPAPARRTRSTETSTAANPPAILRQGPRLQLRKRTIEGAPSTELLFERLLGDADHAFWLDSAGAPTPLARCSYMGTSSGPDSCLLEYDVEQRTVTERRDGTISTEHGSIFEILERRLRADPLLPKKEEIPPGLLGGFVGYLGYECKADCGSPNAHHSDLPDAVMMLANRIVAVDHLNRRTHVIALATAQDEDAQEWLDAAEAVVHALVAEPAEREPMDDFEHAGSRSVSFRCGRGREQYLADIARCQAALNCGESYEICLTDQIATDASPDPWTLYRLLRRRNPAPFGAYLKLGELAVLSSSPERFLSIGRDRRVQARPIKGTAPRSRDPLRDRKLGAQLRSDEKTFAEHLMIVDLLRNDLGRVCTPGSVSVPELMVVEPYATVHQLISNVTGMLEPGRTPVDCVRACFPGGSMTGAPKLRTMGIIDDIERTARGPYSGALGYFGLDGTVDLSIIIRTIVLQPSGATIGAGGAIVTQSDPQQEFDELLLKARAPMEAIAQAMTGSAGDERWTLAPEPTLAMAGEA